MIRNNNKGTKILRATAGFLMAAFMAGVARAQTLAVAKGASFHNTVDLASENESVTLPIVPVTLATADRKLMKWNKSKKGMEMKKKMSKKSSSTCVSLSSVDDAGDDGTRLRRTLLKMGLDQTEEEDIEQQQEETYVEGIIPKSLDERHLQSRWYWWKNKRKNKKKKNKWSMGKHKSKGHSMPVRKIEL